MRVWDFPPNYLCDKHLLAQHNEMHCIYSIIVNGKGGFAHHPEVMRWQGWLGSLFLAHGETAVGMLSRGITHQSEMPEHHNNTLNFGHPEPWQPIPDQLAVLKAKSDIVLGCNCYQKLKEAGY